MSELALWKAVWAAVLHAIGSPLEALIRVIFEGGLVYAVCRSWKFMKAVRWTREPLVANSYIRRVHTAYGVTPVLLNLFLLLPLDILRAVCLSIPSGFYLDVRVFTPEPTEGCPCSTCGATTGQLGESHVT